MQLDHRIFARYPKSNARVFSNLLFNPFLTARKQKFCSTLKKRTDMISAMEEQEVGWPDLLAVVIFTEWILHITNELLI